MNKVCVSYRDTSAGRTALHCALDVARMLGVKSISLFVPCDSGAAALVGESTEGGCSTQGMRIVQAVRASGVLDDFEVHCYDSGSPAPFPEDAVIVDSEVPHRRIPQAVLDPAHETSLFARRQGPILVAFSDGDSGLVAATAAFELALRRRQTKPVVAGEPEVILYHTTWADPEAISQDPKDQMCDAAIKVMLALEQAAGERGVAFATIVETHDDVVQGVVEIALRERAVLIAVARGAQIRQGSYVDRVVAQSPIPIWLAGCGTTPVRPAAGDEAVKDFKALQLGAVRKALSQPLTQPLTQRSVPVWQRVPLLTSPVFVMVLVAAMYIGKAICKIAVGSWINSPMISGDGFHNIADLLEAAAVAMVIIIARRPSTEHYPYGRKNIEWFTSLAIGLMLFVAAGKFALDCVAGLISYAPGLDAVVRSGVPFLPHHQEVNIDNSTFPWVLAVTGISFLLSLLVSRYQVAVGKRSGHASLVADGEETASDGWIEAVTVFGVVVQFATGWRFVEYPLGLLVSVMIFRTGRELFLNGWRVLLQHTIGLTHEANIRQVTQQVPAVSDVRELKTFQVGQTAVVMITVETLANAHGLNYVKKGVEEAIRAYFADPNGPFKGSDVHVKMQRPDPRRHRVGYALVMSDGHTAIARDLDQATHIAVCDVEHGDVVRSKVLPVSSDVPGQLLDKRIQVIFTLDGAEPAAQCLRNECRKRLAGRDKAKIVPIPQLHRANCFTVSALGLEV